MEGKVLLQDLGEALARHNHLSKKDAENFVRTFFEVLTISLRDEKVVKIKGLGVFKLVSVGSRESVNVSTGERFEIQSHTKVSFTPDAALANLVNKPFAQFETVVLNDDADLSLMESVSDLPLDDADEDADIPERSDLEDAEVIDDSSPRVEETGRVEEQAILPDTPAAADTENAFAAEGLEENADEEVSGEQHVAENIRQANAPMDAVSAVSPIVTGSVDAGEPSVSDVPAMAGLQSQEPEPQDEEQCDVKTEVSGVLSEPIEWKRMPRQDVETQVVSHQTVKEQTVKEQTVEHQTIEHQHVVMPHKDDFSHHRKPNRKGLAARVLLWSLLVLLLIVGAYFIGYYGILAPEKQWRNLPKPELEATAPAAVPSRSNAVKASEDRNAKMVSQDATTQPDTENNQAAAAVKNNQGQDQNETADVDTKCTAEEIAEAVKKYPQKKNGKYLIVGTLTTHVVKKGESLYHLAKDVYGEKDFAPYIIVYNRISNPDHVEVGTLLKLPSLKCR